MNTKLKNGGSLKVLDHNGNIIVEVHDDGTIDGIKNDLIVSITWADLVELRDNKELVAGMKYRITDYETYAVGQDITYSINRFDIIVEAIDNEHLSEEARACHSLRDELDYSIYLNDPDEWFIRHPEGDDDYEDEHYYCFKSGDMFVYLKSLSVRPNVNNVWVACTSDDTYVSIDEAEWLETASAQGSSILKYEYGHFLTSDVEAWKIWYCLDNDTKRFGWADEDDGKGVIYRMIDEYGNDCPYDFKNILFKRKLNSVGEYDPSGNVEAYCYTFNWVGEDNVTTYDASILGNDGTLYDDEGYVNGVSNNTIKPYFDGYGTQDKLKMKLNNIVFISNYDYEAGNYYGVQNNEFGGNCRDMTFSNGCRNSVFGSNCRNNVFDNDCRYIILGNDCYSNHIKGAHIIFGNGCRSNTLEGNGNIIFGNECYNNLLANGCGKITFGNYVGYAFIGGYDCSNITFGDGIITVNLDRSQSKNIVVESGCQYIDFYTSSPTGGICNVHVHLGIKGTTHSHKQLSVTANNTYETAFKPTNSVEIEV